jgi:hypothetical protein
MNLLKRDFILRFAPKLYFLLVYSATERLSPRRNSTAELYTLCTPPQRAQARGGEDPLEGNGIPPIPPSHYVFSTSYHAIDLIRGQVRINWGTSTRSLPQIGGETINMRGTREDLHGFTYSA